MIFIIPNKIAFKKILILILHFLYIVHCKLNFKSIILKFKKDYFVLNYIFINVYILIIIIKIKLKISNPFI